MAKIERNLGFSRRTSTVVNNNNSNSRATIATPEEKYLIRLPRTGLHNRTDFTTPLFLPNIYDNKDVSQRNNFSASFGGLINAVNIFKESSRHKVDTLTSIGQDHEHLIGKSSTEIGADCKVNNDRFLLFDGDFEGGNLARVEALEITEPTITTNSTCVEYNIYVHADPCHPISPLTSGVESHWFFFRIQRTIAGCCYRFHVKNMTLPCGQELQLRPVCISETSYQRNPTAGWSSRLIGDDISCSANELGSSLLHTLSFSLLSEFDNDSIYIALSAPYTYTHLQNVIHTLVHDPQNSNTITLQTLCHSAAGNRCDVMIIMDSKDKNAVVSETLDETGDEEPTVVPRFLRSLVERTRNDIELIKSKRAVVVVARQIASDTASSFACEGLIHFLLGASATARRLRQHFVFYVIPMLNPDGVINGLSRSDITGLHLGRQWRQAGMQLDPIVYHCKRLLLSLSRRQDLRLCAFLDITSEESHPIGVNIKSAISSTRENTKIWARRFFIAAAAHSALTKLRHCSIRTVADEPDFCGSVVVADCDITLSLAIELSRQRSATQPMTALDYSRYGCVICASLGDVFLSDGIPSASTSPAAHHGVLSQLTVVEAVRDCDVSADDALLREAKLFDETVWDTNTDASRSSLSTVCQYPPLELQLFTLSQSIRFTHSFSERARTSSPQLMRTRTLSDQSDRDGQDDLDRDLYGEFLLERLPTTKNLKKAKDVSFYYHSTSLKVLKQRPTSKGSFLTRQEIKPATVSLTFPSDALVVDESGKEPSSQPLQEEKTENTTENDNSNGLVSDTVTSDDKKEEASNPNPIPNYELPSAPVSLSASTSLAVVGLSMSEPEKTRLGGVGSVASTTQNSRIGDRGLIKIKFHRPNHNRKGILGKTLGSQRGSVSFFVDRAQLPSLLNVGQGSEREDSVIVEEDATTEEQAEEIDELKAIAELDAVLGRHSLPVTVGGPNKGFQVVARVPSQKEIPSKRSPRIKSIREESSSIMETDNQFVDSIHDDDDTIKALNESGNEADQMGNISSESRIRETTHTDSDGNNRVKSPLYYFGGKEFSLSRPTTENDSIVADGATSDTLPWSENLFQNKKPSIILTSSSAQQSRQGDRRVPSPGRVANTPIPSPPERDTTQSPSFTDGLSPLNHFTDFESPLPTGHDRLSCNPNSPDSEYNRFRELVLEDMGLLSGAGYRETISSSIEISAEMKNGRYYHRPGPHTKTSASKTFPVRQQLLVERPPNRTQRARPCASYRSTMVKGYAGIVPEEKLRQRLTPARPPFHGEGSDPYTQVQQVKKTAYMRAEKALFYLEKDAEADQTSISAQQIATFLHQELVLEHKESTALKEEEVAVHDNVASEEAASGNELDEDSDSKASQRKWIAFPSVPTDLRDNSTIFDDEKIGTLN